MTKQVNLNTGMNNANNAAAVVRVSSTKQGLIGDSPEDQKEQILRVANINDLKVKVWFPLIESASGEIQPLQKVVDYCRDHPGEIQYCLIKSIDRFTRGGAYSYVSLKNQFAKYGVTLIDVYGVISPQRVNTLEHLGVEYPWSVYSPSYTSELLEAEKSKDEIRNILTRMIGSSIRYVQLGYRVRPAPPGYQNERVETVHGLRVVLKPHPTESKWFNMIFDLRTAGNLSDQQIVDHVNSLGYKSRVQKIHSKEDKTKIVGHKGEKPMSVKQLQRFLQNPIYAGINTESWTNGIPVKEKFEGLVSIETFNKANRGKISIYHDEGGYKVYKGKIPSWQTVKNKNNPMYPYKDYVLCPKCGGKLRASASKGKKGTYYPAYHCDNGHQYYRIPLKEFEKTIEEYVNKIEFSLEFRDRFKRIVLEEWEKRLNSTNTDSMILEEKVLELRQEFHQIKERIKQVSSPVAIQALEEDLERVQVEIAKATQIRDNHEDKHIDTQLMINRALYFMEHPKDLILGSLNPFQNAGMFSLLFDQTPNYQELKDGTPTLCPLFQLKEAFQVSESQFVTPLGFEPKFTG